jgi:hypothetical protein
MAKLWLSLVPELLLLVQELLLLVPELLLLVPELLLLLVDGVGVAVAAVARIVVTFDARAAIDALCY